jgi:hypothetical protein
VLEDEIKKAKTKLAGSPKWDQFWSSKRTDWLGDPDFVGIAQAYKDILESSARVYSGVTGAGGTPVSFLQLAEKDVPEKPTLGQVVKLKDVMPKLFEIRKKATEDEIDKLSNLATLPTKKEQVGEDAARAKANKAAEGGSNPQAGSDEAGKQGGTRATMRANEFKTEAEARSALKQVNAAIRESKGDPNGLLKEQKAEIEAAVAALEKNKPKELKTKSGVKFTVTVRESEK